MWKRIIKYLLNFAGIGLMIFYANLGFGIIARVPECENAKSVIWNVVGELCKIYLVYLIVITAINILFEKKIEKRSSKEFVVLAIINLVLLVLVTSYFSNQFYNICCSGK